MKFTRIALALTAVFLASQAQADKLDDIIESGKLRCAVTLDFPPMGSRDAQNNPVGFDVDYCNDLAKVLGVTAEVVVVLQNEDAYGPAGLGPIEMRRRKAADAAPDDNQVIGFLGPLNWRGGEAAAVSDAVRHLE